MQPPATSRLNELPVKLLVERGDTDALHACADADTGDYRAKEHIVELCTVRRDLDPLRVRAS
ncbi:hypothetical protein [Catenuloplanes japonicus]|uniref:hypothetical protein n=1 Tax=Catenuloplanes japonicus TaxID=33876 RepID=UPI000524F8BC|nr:hypothetical protein [Catenuloplanes japonicus]